MAIDTDKLNDFMGRFVHNLGAVMHAATRRPVRRDCAALLAAKLLEPQPNGLP